MLFYTIFIYFSSFTTPACAVSGSLEEDQARNLSNLADVHYSGRKHAGETIELIPGIDNIPLNPLVFQGEESDTNVRSSVLFPNTDRVKDVASAVALPRSLEDDLSDEETVHGASGEEDVLDVIPSKSELVENTASNGDSVEDVRDEVQQRSSDKLNSNSSEGVDHEIGFVAPVPQERFINGEQILGTVEMIKANVFGGDSFDEFNFDKNDFQNTAEKGCEMQRVACLDALLSFWVDKRWPKVIHPGRRSAGLKEKEVESQITWAGKIILQSHSDATEDGSIEVCAAGIRNICALLSSPAAFLVPKQTIRNLTDLLRRQVWVTLMYFDHNSTDQDVFPSVLPFARLIQQSDEWYDVLSLWTRNHIVNVIVWLFKFLQAFLQDVERLGKRHLEPHLVNTLQVLGSYLGKMSKVRKSGILERFSMQLNSLLPKRATIHDESFPSDKHYPIIAKVFFFTIFQNINRFLHAFIFSFCS